MEHFSLGHAVTVAVCAAITALAIVLGRRWRAMPGKAHLERRMVLGYAVLTFVTQAGIIVWLCWPGNFVPWVSLPLHVCDIAAWIAPLALLTSRRGLRAMLYFWGIGLSTQAFVTPTVSAGPGDVWFWAFWITHLQIVGAAVYDVVARGFRPRWRDLGVAVFYSTMYGVAMVALNSATEWNYGFLGPARPSAPTIIDALGPWPLRTVWMALIGYFLFAVLTVVWKPNRAAAASACVGPCGGP